jgi:hypothetical protein
MHKNEDTWLQPSDVMTKNKVKIEHHTPREGLINMQADRAPEWQRARAAKRQSNRYPELSRANTTGHRVEAADDRRETNASAANGD